MAGYGGRGRVAISTDSEDAGRAPPEQGTQDWAGQPQFLSALVETQADIAGVELEPDAVMRRVVERAQDLSGADAAVIDAVEGDETVHKAACGFAAGCVGRRLKIGSSLTGLALRQQAIVRCDDAETDDRVDRDACRQSGTRAMVIVPLLRNGGAVGVLRVLARRPFAFGEPHVAALRLIAGVVTSALKNAIDMEEKRRLLAERSAALEWEEDRARLLERIAHDAPPEDVLEDLAEVLGRRMRAATVAALLLRDGAMRLIGGARLAPALAEAIDARALSLAAALCSHPVGREVPVVGSDVTADPAWVDVRDAASGAGAGGCWSAAARLPDDSFAALLLAFTPEFRPPTTNEHRLLRAAAHLAAVAVERDHITRRLAHLATHDALTGLPHRAVFEDRLQQAIALARRKGHLVAVLAVDLDHFKRINDTMGHAAGDELLQQVARRLRNTLRDSDTVARMGGDEFMILLPELGDRDDASRVAAKLVHEFAAPCDVRGMTLRVTGSVGVAIYPLDAADGASIQKVADDALYRAKQMGRNGFALKFAISPNSAS